MFKSDGFSLNPIKGCVFFFFFIGRQLGAWWENKVETADHVPVSQSSDIRRAAEKSHYDE